jgi:hypothetical protein
VRDGVVAGTVYKYDLSIPLESMYDLVQVVRDRLRPYAPQGVRVVR